MPGPLTGAFSCLLVFLLFVVLEVGCLVNPIYSAIVRMTLHVALQVPKDIVDRNLKRAADAKAADFTEIVYECYGHGKSGFVIEALTDNVNRSATNVSASSPLPVLLLGVRQEFMVCKSCVLGRLMVYDSM